MNIALLTDGIYPFVVGGMQKHSYNLVKYLSLNGHHVLLYHSLAREAKLPYHLKEFKEDELLNIEHRAFHFPISPNIPGHYLRSSYKLSSLYRKELLRSDKKIDLIYAQGFMAWALFKEGKGELNAPIIVNFHGLEMFQKAASFKMRLEQLLLGPSVVYNLKRADRVISLGGKLNAILEKHVTKDKIITNSIGIESSWLDGTIKNNPVRKFVFIGRNERRKGIKELNETISHLNTVNFELHIIGPFDEVDKVDDSRVFYYGEIKSQEKIMTLLSQMDVLVLPSWSEGMPTVILEAMSRSCAILATDVGAVTSMVDKNNGWLCEPGNLRSLKEGFHNALTCSMEELNSKKAISFKRVNDLFTWDKVIKEFISKLNF